MHGVRVCAWCSYVSMLIVFVRKNIAFIWVCFIRIWISSICTEIYDKMEKIKWNKTLMNLLRFGEEYEFKFWYEGRLKRFELFKLEFNTFLVEKGKYGKKKLKQTVFFVCHQYDMINLQIWWSIWSFLNSFSLISNFQFFVFVE